METNSIKANLSKEDTIADIRMTLGADFEHKKCIVLVEGEDDIVFFNGKLHRDIEIKESFSGKRGVKEIVEEFSDNRVIGICDADYDATDCPRLLYYDNSCLEMMLVSNDNAFGSLFCIYYQGKMQAGIIRLQIFSNLKWLSLYRKLSSENNWGVNFKGVSINNAFNNDTYNIEIPKLLKQISEQNPHLSESIRSHVDSVVEAANVELDLNQYLRITQGHDFIFCFRCYCEAVHVTKGKTPSAAEILHVLIGSFPRDAWKNTTLYRELNQYETSHSLKLLSSI